MRSLVWLFVLALVPLAVAGPQIAGAAAPVDPPPGDAPAQCELGPATDLGDGFFADVSDASGVRDQNFDPEPPANIAINDHSRVAFADINGDGFDDIVAHSLFPNPMGGVPFEHLVFTNNGDGTFTNISDESGLRDVQAGFFLFGDVDNDGDQDAFAGLDYPVPNAGNPDPANRHQILLNDGAGQFTHLPGSGVDVAFSSGGQRVHFTGNAVFADFDGDADLDLYLGNGQTSAGVPDQLFMGNGDGTFVNVTDRLPRIDRASNGSTTCDFDNDRDQDVFVSVYGISVQNGHNVLWQNDGAGNFSNVARALGFEALLTGNYYLAATGHGRDPQPNVSSPDGVVGGNGFGLQCADVTNDGLMDVFLTTISHPNASDFGRTWSDPSQLLVNRGPDADYAFENVWLDRDLPFNEGDVDGAVVDFDNDGYPDLSLSRERKYEGNYTDPEQKGWFGLMQQQADGSFESVGLQSGINDMVNDPPDLLRMKGAQNHAWSDVDHDGDVDLLVGGRAGGKTGRPNFLFENRVLEGEGDSTNGWLAFRLTGDGVHVNRDAIGARVELDFGDLVMLREITSSRGMYNSMDTRTLHFGLGRSACDFTARIIWPNGNTWSIAAADLGRDRLVELAYSHTPSPDYPTATSTATPGTRTPVTPAPTDTVTPVPTYTAAPPPTETPEPPPSVMPEPTFTERPDAWWLHMPCLFRQS